MTRSRALLLALLVIGTAFTPPQGETAPRPAPKPAGTTTQIRPSKLEGLEIFQLDSPHSPIGFTVSWMGLSKVRGTFDDCLGTIVFDAKDLTRSSVSIMVRTPSLHTGSAMRDKDLKGPDWFDVEKFPTSLFRSTAIARDGEGYRMKGSLTIRGVTRDVEFPFNFNGRLVQPSHEVRVGIEGRLTVNRRDFGLTGPARFNVLTNLGKEMIGDEVEIPLALEGWRAGARDTLFDPVADSLSRRVTKVGFATVAKEYREERLRTPDSLMVVGEAVLNTLGYGLIDRGQPQVALQAFQLEAESYPQSGFPMVGLAQVYAVVGDDAHAIESANKALALNPNALRAMEILRRVQATSN